MTKKYEIFATNRMCIDCCFFNEFMAGPGCERPENVMRCADAAHAADIDPLWSAYREVPEQ